MKISVVFGPTGARIFHGEIPNAVKDLPCLVDPVFPKGIAPHRWRLVDGKINTVSETEALLAIKKAPVVKSVPNSPTSNTNTSKIRVNIFIKLAATLVAGMIIGYFL